MLHEFLFTHRLDLIERCKAKVALRAEPKTPDNEVEHGVPLFLDQLIKTLQVEQSGKMSDGLKISGGAGGVRPALSELGETATLHGRDLSRRGFTVEQVVHDYGDLCQAITDLAFERQVEIEIDEFRTMNRCLDNGIAVAVTEFNYQREFIMADEQADAMNERLGMFAHELRNYLNTAMLALMAIKDGDVGFSGATGGVLDRSLIGLRNLIDRSLTDVRLTAGLPLQHKLFSLADFIGEIKLSATLEAQVKGCTLHVSVVDQRLALDADRDLLLAAVGNLLQNAFKFTLPNTQVTLNAYTMAGRILIDVEDCGPGLPAGEAEKMFQPFTQGAGDRTGLGLGLTIVRRSVEASDGLLSAHNSIGSGCVFTIDLPRHTWTAEDEVPLVS